MRARSCAPSAIRTRWWGGVWGGEACARARAPAHLLEQLVFECRLLVVVKPEEEDGEQRNSQGGQARAVQEEDRTEETEGDRREGCSEETEQARPDREKEMSGAAWIEIKCATTPRARQPRDKKAAPKKK